MYSCKQVISFVSRFMSHVYTIVERINFQAGEGMPWCDNSDMLRRVTRERTSSEATRLLLDVVRIHYRLPHELSFVQVLHSLYYPWIYRSHVIKMSVIGGTNQSLSPDKKKREETISVTTHRQSANSVSFFEYLGDLSSNARKLCGIMPKFNAYCSYGLSLAG